MIRNPFLGANLGLAAAVALMGVDVGRDYGYSRAPDKPQPNSKAKKAKRRAVNQRRKQKHK